MSDETAPFEEAKKEAAPRSPDAHSSLRVLGDFLRLLIIAAAIAIPVRYFIAQPFIVRGASMEPNYYDREYLIVDELSYFLRKPTRGEVVVFRAPLDTSEYFIKRVIGLPGEKVDVRDGVITITNDSHPDGMRLEEPYLPPSLRTPGVVSFELGETEYVVLGDNRIASSDSRSWGTLDLDLITGRVVFRAWPPAKFGMIREP